MDRRRAPTHPLTEPAPASETPAPAPAAPAPPPAAPAPAQEAAPAYVAELEQLASLREAGVLTDEEFEAKKRQILGL